jgi:hypothetical protein
LKHAVRMRRWSKYIRTDGINMFQKLIEVTQWAEVIVPVFACRRFYAQWRSCF